MTVIEKLNHMKECGLHLDFYGNSINAKKWRVQCVGERDGTSIKCVVVADDFTSAIEELYEKFFRITNSGFPQLAAPVITQSSDNLSF